MRNRRIVDCKVSPSPSRRRLLGGVAAMSALGSSLTGCKLAGSVRKPPKNFNFRLTITAEMGGQTKTASTVQNFAWRGWSTQLASMNSLVYRSDGEGAVLDFGSDGVVVSTVIRLFDSVSETNRTAVWGLRPPMTREWPAANYLATALLGERPDDIEVANWWLPLADLATSRDVDLELKDLQLVLWFKDHLIPAGVARVDVDAPPPGTPRLISATISITQDPLTQGQVATALPWIDDYYQRGLDLGGNPGIMTTPAITDAVIAADILGYRNLPDRPPRPR
jgi:hypothetical protein